MGALYIIKKVEEEERERLERPGSRMEETSHGITNKLCLKQRTQQTTKKKNVWTGTLVGEIQMIEE